MSRITVMSGGQPTIPKDRIKEAAEKLAEFEKVESNDDIRKALDILCSMTSLYSFQTFEEQALNDVISYFAYKEFQDKMPSAHCIDGSCPMAYSEEYEERGMDVVHSCEECGYGEKNVAELEVCEWNGQHGILLNHYTTKCGKLYEELGNASDYKYCPYCGRKMVIK